MRQGARVNGIRQWVSIGAIVGMLSSLLVFQLAGAIWFMWLRDGLLPKMFARFIRSTRLRIQHLIAGLVVKSAGI
jgi:APA family basic amino acid/polyamine antiporter